jgi:simple sugar transport system ATP-binding protein
MEEIAIDVLGGAVQISGIDNPRKDVGFLSGGQKQAVAIARAVYLTSRPRLSQCRRPNTRSVISAT